MHRLGTISTTPPQQTRWTGPCQAPSAGSCRSPACREAAQELMRGLVDQKRPIKTPIPVIESAQKEIISPEIISLQNLYQPYYLYSLPAFRQSWFSQAAHRLLLPRGAEF